jgi:hypothetical protein
VEAFLIVTLLVTLALAATSNRLQRFRGSRPIAMLTSGGWIWLGVGALLGPGVMDMVSKDVVASLTPLAAFALGWAGMMIGLQAERTVLRSLPRIYYSASLADAAISAIVFGGVGHFLLRAWTDAESAALIAPTALLAATGVGWTMETRSLQTKASASAARLSTLVRSVGALTAIIAVFLWGVVESGATFSIDQGFSAKQAAMHLVSSLSVALLIALLARLAMRLAPPERADLLTIFVAVVALTAGASMTLHAPTLFTGMLTGVALANLGGAPLRRFERFLLRAEHVVAVVLSLLAGILIDPKVGAVGVGAAVGLTAIRLIVKPGSLALAWRLSNERAPRAKRLTALHFASVRLSPVAVALCVDAALVAPSVMAERVLTIVVLMGLMCEMAPLALTIGSDAPMTTTTTPDLDRADEDDDHNSDSVADSDRSDSGEPGPERDQPKRPSTEGAS